MKLRKKLMLLEDFKTQANAKVNTEVKAEVKTKPETKTGEAIRTEVIADVDAILTNLETLSAQMSEGNITLNESFDDIMKSIMSTVNYGKASAMLKDFGDLSMAANQNVIDDKIAGGIEKFAAQKEKLGTLKAKAKGPAKEKIQKQIDAIAAKEDKIVLYKEKTKAKADDVLAAFKVKLDKTSSTITGKLKELFSAQQAKVVSDVKITGLELKTKLAIKAGNKKREEAAKIEAVAAEGVRKGIEDDIKKGKDVAADDIAELKGVQPFMQEIEAFTAARDESKKLEDKIAAVAPSYNLTESLGIEHVFKFLVESKILSLFTKAKGEQNKENLTAAKALAGAVKKASGEEWKAKKALHDKVAAAKFVSSKAIITLAGGDADSAQEVDGGYKLGELIPKWGGSAGFIAAEEFGPIKKALEVEDGVDQAIVDAEKGGGAKGKEDKKKLEDAITGFKDEISALQPEAGADAVNPKVKAAIEVKQFTAEIALAKLNDEDTTELETKLTKATNTAEADPLPGGGNTDDLTDDQNERIAAEETQIAKREQDIKDEEAKDEPNQQKIDGLKAGIVQNNKDIADIKAEQNNSLRINSKDLKIVSEASLSGLQSYDSEEDGYKWLKAEAKKMGVKLSVDKDPYGDGTDELNATGDKSALQKFAALTGHDQDLGTEEEGAVYVIKETEAVEEGNEFSAARAEAIAKGEKTFKVGDEEYPVEDVSTEDEENAEEFVEEATELPKTINLDEGLTIAQKFAKLM
jgi:hypothetical protein